MRYTYKKTTDTQTDRWLRNLGLCPKTFSQLELLFVQALRAAFSALKKHGDLLTHEQEVTLNLYRLAMTNRTLREKLTERHAHAVLNIATAVRRQYFRQMRLKKIIPSSSKKTK